jgi:Icc-related predicted phosphoesterase
VGDFTFSFEKRLSMYSDFNDWLGELPHRYRVVVPGNHDLLLEQPRNRKLITNATLVVNSAVEIDGLKIWGSPVNLDGMAFRMSKPEDRKRHWAQMPKGIDILITHGPPLGVLDVEYGTQEHAGDPQLLKAVIRMRPRLHVFGHTHGGYGTATRGFTKFVNAALYGELGDLEKPPVLLQLNPTKGRRA